MKKYLIILLLYSCQSNNETKATKAECEQFKNGRFVHIATADRTQFTFERNDTIQKEFIGNTGDFVNLQINWTSPCSYELTFINQQVVGGDSVPVVHQNRTVKVEILEVRNDSCFIISDDGYDRLRGIVFKARG